MAGIRVYADTSVFGGCLDEEFRRASRTFFDQVRAGHFALLTSALVEAELGPGPAEVGQLFDDMLPSAEVIGFSADALALQQAYVEAGVVSPKWATDALHVALATVAGCRIIVSWNFKHIVHFEKIPLYNAINTVKGHLPIGICSPQQVIAYEDEDV